MKVVVGKGNRLIRPTAQVLCDWTNSDENISSATAKTERDAADISLWFLFDTFWEETRNKRQEKESYVAATLPILRVEETYFREGF